MPLTLKQRLFVEHYLVSRNGVQAARLAGYKGEYMTLNSVARENLQKPPIREEIERRLDPLILTGNQVLIGLSAIADFDIAEVFEEDGTFNLKSAKARGVTRFIKSVSFDKDTGKVTKIEAYSAHEAYRDMGKHRGLFPTKIEIAKEVADDAINRSGVPLPETFGDLPVHSDESK